MLMSKDVNCSNFRGLFGFLRKQYGEEGVQQVVNGLVDNDRYLIADKEDPSRLVPVQEHHLIDPAYWVSFEFSNYLFANAKNVFGGSNQLIKAGMDATVNHFSKSTFFISRIFSTQFLCKQASKLNARFNRTKEVKLTELTSHSARFELHYHPGFRAVKDVCNWNVGIYTGLANITGARDAKCEEIQCMTDGADHCVFLLTWRKGPNILKRMIRWVLKGISKDLMEDYAITLNERDRLIDHLTQSMERYRALTDQSLTGVFIHHRGLLVYVNDRLANMLNYSPQEMTGKIFWDFVHPDDRHMVKKREMDRSSGFDHSTNYEFRAFQKGGELVWLELFAANIHYNGKKACMGNVIDLTAKKQTEEALNLSSEKLLKEHHQRKVLSKRLIDLLEKDRHEIAMELHDHVGQMLTSLKIGLEVMDTQFKSKDTALASHIKVAKEKTVGTIKDIKNISRGLKPSMLDTLGLVSSLRELFMEIQEKTDLKINFFWQDVPQRFSEEKELAIYRIAQEALNNIIKHAMAKSVFVNLNMKQGMISLSVEDDGVGFDPEKVMSAPRAKGPLGLIIMRERAVQISGELTIDSKVGGGTHLLVEIPI